MEADSVGVHPKELIAAKPGAGLCSPAPAGSAICGDVRHDYSNLTTHTCGLPKGHDGDHRCNKIWPSGGECRCSWTNKLICVHVQYGGAT